MFKIYSKGCAYALRVLTRIPLSCWSKGFLAKDICSEAGVSESSTRKILQSLVHAGLLKGVPGPGGGYVLTKNPQEISLLQIIKIIEGQDTFDQCVMGLSECDNANPCGIHNDWVKIKEIFVQTLSKRTLYDLMKNKDKLNSKTI